MAKVIAYIITRALLIILVFIWFVVHIFKNGKVLSWERFGKNVQRMMGAHEKLINRSLIVFLILFFLFMTVFCVVPAIHDLPAMIHKDYITIQGQVTVQDYSYSDRVRIRPIRILEKETMTEKKVTVISMGIQKGENIEVEYLRYSRIGIVTKRY